MALELIKRPVVLPRRPAEEVAVGEMLDSILKEVLALRQTEEAELEILRHTRTIPEDYDASDGVTYDLEDGEAATTTIPVPSHYIFLFKRFFTSDIVGTTYETYIDDRLYIKIPDLEFPMELGVPVEHEVKIVVTNLSGAKQSYRTFTTGFFRPKELWERKIRRVW